VATTPDPAPSLPIAGDILPDTARVTADGHLWIGGLDVVGLAREFGTPLYVYDVATIRDRIRGFRSTLAEAYDGPATVAYAAKAYGAPWLLRLVADEGAGLDVVSGGELFAAAAAGFPRERIVVHGNNKRRDEVELALAERVGRIVLDNLDEIALVGRLAAEAGIRQPVLLRVSPDVDAHTHAHLTTGRIDTKFGLGIHTGAAEAGVRAALAQPSLELVGLHAHIGSLIESTEPYLRTIDRLLDFAARMRDAHGFRLLEFSPGGGYAVRYTPDSPPVSPRSMVADVARHLATRAREHGFVLPALTVEPGRSIVASAAIAVYEVGSVKAIPGGRTYVAVDGGMADNIRPTAYGSRYSALLANRVSDLPAGEFAIVGRYCETGDILIESIALPVPAIGDLVAIPVAGAYQLAMAGNYNLAQRPAVVAVADGTAHLVRRREAYDDLLAADVLEPIEF
jgi:diaminopimelate decarboxylase